ncbi:MAG: glycoside hydrolase family 2 protein [Opitutaceae bacterium]|jgi:beta-mannosidase|nr:glycoside hydrolase family 2 protein [Opitutaceae bacterium]
MTIQPLTGDSWQFRECARGAAAGWHPAAVPGCVHSDLLRNKLIPEPFRGRNELGLQWIEERDWEYRLRFEAGAALLREETVELAADGVDTFATFFLNGREIGRSDNMFTAWRRDVKALLRPGANELRVVFGSAMKYIRANRRRFAAPQEFNDPVGGCVLARKQQSQFGWDWGPRFVTCGVWREIRLEGWSGNRFAHVEISQRHPARRRAPGRGAGAVVLRLRPELRRPARGLVCEASVALRGRVVAAAGPSALRGAPGGGALEITVPEAELWWPAGLGAQPLHEVTLRALDRDGRVVDAWTRRVGLRTLELVRKPDAWGESFKFVVNGAPVFLKGANWIPADSFVAGLDRARYARDVRAAAAANFNALRVWGGGVYESEDFYDLCDELGLLVWQDFMFACTLCPADRAFLRSVEAEARHQVRRLHHRACLALWCGNNEIVMANGPRLRGEPRRGYEKLFHRLLPAAVRAHGAGTAYWPTSPWRGGWRRRKGHAAGERRGDTHYWDVWHARQPVRDYEKWKFRFVSEFGMQSFCTPKTQATFCPADDANVFGPDNENHQKNRAGNQLILDYVSRRYRFPKNQAALGYLSQLNQAHAMRTAVEHYRRLMPRCMGALYWQLNDCWPAASWSSIEYTGEWKALHHAARRFYAPAAASALVIGDETAGIGNYRRSTVERVDLYTVYDGPGKKDAVLAWEIFHLDGRVLAAGRRKVALRHGESRRRRSLAPRKLMAAHGRDNLVLRLALEIDGALAGEDSVFLVPPRFIALRRGATRVTVKKRAGTADAADAGTAGGARRFALTFLSREFQHGFHFDLDGLAHAASDNYFELFPGRAKTVDITLDRPATAAAVRAALRVGSLVDSYE